tara:strand:+ start:210 stop:1181 length:972 start_codon:yes stop_codon:yes gene_type:complete
MSKFTFIDLFAGIGGTRIAFENAGGECVFSSEMDRFAKKTYEENFGEEPFGDITGINPKVVPDHNILVAGFPCQPFSIAGVSSSNSRGVKHGFDHVTQGTMFFEIERILATKKPEVFLLENVKNLKSHDGGKTFKVILDTLQNRLKYKVYWDVIDAQSVVPQHRERTYIVGFKNRKINYSFPPIKPAISKPTLKDDILEQNPDRKYTLTEHRWQYFKDYKARHLAKGNGFGYGIVDPNDPEAVTRTLTARYYKDGAEILIETGDPTPRKLTPRECSRLMGFPDSFKIPVSDTQAYKQFGNSVVVPVVDLIAKSMIQHINMEIN